MKTKLKKYKAGEGYIEIIINEPVWSCWHCKGLANFWYGESNVPLCDECKKEYEKSVFDETKFKPIIYQSEIPLCVMCGRIGWVVAPENDEPLCRSCRGKNDEARRKNDI